MHQKQKHKRQWQHDEKLYSNINIEVGIIEQKSMPGPGYKDPLLKLILNLYKLLTLHWFKNQPKDREAIC